jgi:hypothetical protein
MGGSPWASASTRPKRDSKSIGRLHRLSTLTQVRELEAAIRVSREHGGQELRRSDISERSPGSQQCADPYIASAMTFQATEGVSEG